MNYLTLLPILLIVGCASTPTMVVVPQEVQVPIAVACKTETPVVPTFCFDSLKSENDLYEKTRCLLSDRVLSKGYELELNIALSSCK